MSTVYEAVDLLDNERTIALKEFNAAAIPSDQRAEALKWLAREAGLLSMLKNPRLPELLDSASEGDRHFIAMPFMEGETLEERVRREGPLPEIDLNH
jgi:serine/threonine protein kinase